MVILMLTKGHTILYKDIQETVKTKEKMYIFQLLRTMVPTNLKVFLRGLLNKR